MIHEKKYPTCIVTDKRINDRLKKLVKESEARSVSFLVNECIRGFLHVIEQEAGPEFQQSERLLKNIGYVQRYFSSILGPEKAADVMAMAFNWDRANRESSNQQAEEIKQIESNRSL